MRKCASAIAVLLLACGASSRQEPAATQDVVTRQEIAASGATSAYEVLRILRPTWLEATDERLPFTVSQQPEPFYDAGCAWTVYIGERGFEQNVLRRTPASRVREIWLVPARARRPDGSRCDRDSPAIHVIMIDESSGGAADT